MYNWKANPTVHQLRWLTDGPDRSRNNNSSMWPNDILSVMCTAEPHSSHHFYTGHFIVRPEPPPKFWWAEVQSKSSSMRITRWARSNCLFYGHHVFTECVDAVTTRAKPIPIRWVSLNTNYQWLQKWQKAQNSLYLQNLSNLKNATTHTFAPRCLHCLAPHNDRIGVGVAERCREAGLRPFESTIPVGAVLESLVIAGGSHLGGL